MKFPILFLLGLLINSCVNQENTKAVKSLNTAIENVSNKYKCQLTYKIILSDEKTNPLNLTLHNSVEYTATIGAIIEDCYVELAKKGIYYDRFILKNSQGVVGMDISRENLEKAIKCKPTAVRVVKALAADDIQSVLQDLDTNYIKPEGMVILQKDAGRLEGIGNYIGFEVAEEKGQLYCIYINFFGSDPVSAICNLEESDCGIIGLSF